MVEDASREKSESDERSENGENCENENSKSENKLNSIVSEYWSRRLIIGELRRNLSNNLDSITQNKYMFITLTFTYPYRMSPAEVISIIRGFPLPL